MCCIAEKKRKKDREWESVCVQSSYFLTFSAFFLSPSQMCSEAPERTQTALNDFSVCSFSCSRRHSLSLSLCIRRRWRSFYKCSCDKPSARRRRRQSPLSSRRSNNSNDDVNGNVRWRKKVNKVKQRFKSEYQLHILFFIRRFADLCKWANRFLFIFNCSGTFFYSSSCCCVCCCCSAL